MDDNQLRAWILEQIEGVENDQLVEDNCVELKATWLTDHHKAARQIAGLINASMGNHVLWIIGLDEDKGVVGAEREEVSEWWPQVAKRFDGVPPEPYTIVIPHKKGNLIGLLFKTEGRPFVVKTKDGSSVEREVPWREGNRTLSARQSDFKRLLSTTSETPEIEVLNGVIRRNIRDPRNIDDPPEELKFRAALELFVFKRQAGNSTLPIHRCTALLTFEDEVQTRQGSRLTFYSESLDDIQITPNKVSIFSSGMLRIYTSVDCFDPSECPSQLRLSITLEFTEANEHKIMDVTFTYSGTDGYLESISGERIPLNHVYRPKAK